ncbi:hypothetical protein [Aquimarina longa]|uniref:hypothetical protein n=1 Tax=Aquimarina longa TaxID=1080221 RepID=UPI000785C37F|nr:hypothetical protein [Aquimarina longa]
MDLTSIIFISGILIPLSVFFFYRKQLENNAQWFIIGGDSNYNRIYISTIEDKKTLYLNMLIPLYAVLLYKGMVYVFVKLFGRMPVDTSFEYRSMYGVVASRRVLCAIHFVRCSYFIINFRV